MTKPGEKRLQILQALAAMLENPKGEKVTTAALAAKLDCSLIASKGKWRRRRVPARTRRVPPHW